MPITLEEVELAALQLDVRERAQLAEHLLSSLDDQDEIQQAWLTEASQRIDAVERGETTLIPLDEALSAVRAALQ